MRALISVSDKTDLENLLLGLNLYCTNKEELEIVSTGGTSKYISENTDIEPIDVSEVTGFPEILGGRVKTLHPMIHGGILPRKFNEEDAEDLETHDISKFDLVVCNLYPFEQAALKDIPIEELIEEIDIGGVTLLRAAAKNFENVFVLSSPDQYVDFLRTIASENDMEISVMRREFAVEVFRRTKEYDAAISQELAQRLLGEQDLNLFYEQGKELRYGENPHQKGLVYKQTNLDPTIPCAMNCEKLHGKEISYNNEIDIDSAIRAARDLRKDIAAIVMKHNMPCGLATGPDLKTALEMAWLGDPVSAFGSIICLTRPLDEETADYIREKYKGQPKFIEVIIAPGYEEAALEKLKKKSKDLRLLQLPELKDFKPMEFRPIEGGILVQTPDDVLVQEWKCVTETEFPEEKRALAEFGIIATRHLKSNSLSLVNEYQPGYYWQVAMGAGQPNRVDCLEKLILPTIYNKFVKPEVDQIAPGPREQIEELKEMYFRQAVEGAVLVSEALLPYDDIVKAAGKCGIKYVVQPGGAKRDQDSIEAADNKDVAMVFTGTRHFRH